MDEKDEKKQEQDNSNGDNDEGVQSDTDKKVAELNAETERINEAVAERDNAKAREQLSGEAEAGQTPPKKEDPAVKEADEIVKAFE